MFVTSVLLEDDVFSPQKNAEASKRFYFIVCSTVVFLVAFWSVRI